MGELNQLSYLQVKGTGLANRCSEVIGEDTITPKSGSRLVEMCIEPKAWAVEEEIGKAGKTEKKFVNSKVMTRQTYTLEGIEGSIKTDGGNIVFSEEEGIDYAPTTVQLPGGERVPFLFTVKELVAKGNGGSFKPGFQMGGDFSVPSYRTGLFLDPKGRGGVTGYDMAVALPGLQSGEEGDAELFKENNKTFDVGQGRIEMEVNKVNAEESEIGGVFVASQPGYRYVLQGPEEDPDQGNLLRQDRVNLVLYSVQHVDDGCDDSFTPSHSPLVAGEVVIAETERTSSPLQILRASHSI